MAHLHAPDLRPVPLRTTHRVGRDPSCALVLADPRVSSEHAIIRYGTGGWEVKDLGSTNGTRVDGRRLGPGERALLKAGSTVEFGAAEHRFTLADDAPPQLSAFPGDGGPPVSAAGDLLALPSAEAPEATVFSQGGGWVFEAAGADARPVVDGESVQVGGRSWTLVLPQEHGGTVEDLALPPHLDDLTLEFAVSRDEEFVTLTLAHPRGRIDLKNRAHHYLLLTLARARQADVPRFPEDPGERGWVYQDDLSRMLGSDDAKIYLEVFRARRQLADAGVMEAARIVERRNTTRQIRIGTERFTIRGA
jgi:hypothetical protein